MQQTFESIEQLSHTVCQELIRYVEQNPGASIALSGGSSPIPIYKKLALQPQVFSKSKFLWSDERLVPIDHPKSNFFHANKHLIKPLGTRNFIHPNPKLPHKECAKTYENHIIKELDGNNIDICLLGVGDDGHIASLFTLDDCNLKGTAIGTFSSDQSQRISFTLDFINKSSYIYLIAYGEKKQHIIQQIKNNRVNKSLPVAHLDYSKVKFFSA